MSPPCSVISSKCWWSSKRQAFKYSCSKLRVDSSLPIPAAPMQTLFLCKRLTATGQGRIIAPFQSEAKISGEHINSRNQKKFHFFLMNFLKRRREIIYFVHFQIFLQGTFTLQSGQMTTCLYTTTALEECSFASSSTKRCYRKSQIKSKLSFRQSPFSISPSCTNLR